MQCISIDMHCISFFDVMTFSQNTEIRKTLNIFHLKIFGKSLLRSLNVLGYLMAFESFFEASDVKLDFLEICSAYL